jgi:hypothetical protein
VNRKRFRLTPIVRALIDAETSVIGEPRDIFDHTTTVDRAGWACGFGCARDFRKSIIPRAVEQFLKLSHDLGVALIRQRLALVRNSTQFDDLADDLANGLLQHCHLTHERR